MQNSDNGFSEFSNAHLEVTFPTVSIYIININNSWIAASSFLNITCQRNLTPLRGTHIVICIILGRKKIRNMCQNAFSLVYTGLECVDLKERNRKQMYDDQLNRRYNSQRKNFTALFKTWLKEIIPI